MDNSGQGGGSSNTETITITVNTTGALTIDKGNCNVSLPDENNPIAGWTKKTYTNPGGTINIEVTGIQADEGARIKPVAQRNPTDNTKGLNDAISREKRGVAELYHYTKGDNQALKLKKDKKYIYYRESTTSGEDQNPTITWKSYSSDSNPSDAGVKTIVEILDRLGTFKEFLKSLVKIVSHS